MSQDTLFNYLLMLGDNAVVHSHRLAEWSSKAPEMEEDIALSNIGLDNIGQARSFLTYAAEVEGKDRDEDALAYLRNDREYMNLLMLELPRGDFAEVIARSFLYAVYCYELYNALLEQSSDEQIKAIAAKSLKEVKYHLRHTHEWMLRLGDGTEESHQRLQNALNELWSFTNEFFVPSPVEQAAFEAGIAPDVASLREGWDKMVNDVLERATLTRPDDSQWMQSGGKQGLHSEHLGYMLAEMQYLQRSYPGLQW